MTKVLVTGGAGYIGSHVVDMLINRGYTVVVFDNLYTGHVEAVHKDATFIKGDLLDKPAVDQVFADHQFDGILHFASHTLVGESMEKPWLYLRDNAVAASNLLEAAAAGGVKRFILSSTANLFDDPAVIPIVAEERIVPGSPYGESKYIIERYLHWMERIYGMAYCCLRYFNASGAHPDGHIGEDHTPEYHLIPIILQVALGQREKLTIFGEDYDTPDGTCIRDYIHVMDLAEAHVLAFEALADGKSRKFNLGNGKGYSIREVLETARVITGETIPAVTGARRPGDPATLIADSTRITNELGWRPEFASLHQIIETAWNWHKSHPNGYTSK
ncbi:MAG: UDP-glucose 4-epimerase GalE [Anaerolineaceae bacterium]|nr:UDP-glucose 4-epimerase GalE [Anaerolineaceae bacterium]